MELQAQGFHTPIWIPDHLPLSTWWGLALGNHYTDAPITPMAQGSLQTKLGSWQRQDSNLGLPGQKGHYPQQHSGPCLQQSVLLCNSEDNVSGLS